MKKSLFFLFYLMLGFSASAQWTVTSTGITADFYSVDYYSPTNIYVGSTDATVKSSDGGLTWSLNPLLFLGTTLWGSTVEDLAFVSPTTGFASGLLDAGNTERILKSTDGGINWTSPVASTAPPLLRYIQALDQNGVRMLGVGNWGRIYRSTNTGSSWSLVTSGVTVALTDVKFATFDTVYACGSGKIIHSYNGGSTWASVSIAQSFTALACRSNVVYATAYNSNVMRKSTNYGASFSAVNLPFTAGYAMHAISKDTLLVSATDGIYVTRDGGVYWEKFILSAYQPVHMFDFISSSDGIAVGLSSYMIRTSNLNAAPCIPVSLFSVSGGSSHCLNDSIVLTNGTSPTAGYTYLWQMDGATFSTSYNTGKKLTTTGPHTVSLITSNVNGSDTATFNITVTGYGLVPMTITANDSACTGTIVGFTLANSQTGASYQLRKGTVNIGTAKAGTGGALEFSSLTGITTSTVFNIKATNPNPCFVDTMTQYIPVVVTSGTGTPAPICTPSNSLCGSPGNDPGIKYFGFGTISNPSAYTVNNYTNYACCEYTTVTLGSVYPVTVTTAYPSGEYVKIWIDYNGDGAFSATSELAFSGFANPTITGNITIAPAVFNQKLRMRVASDYDPTALSNACTDYTCGEIEDYSVTVVPAPVPPTPAFTYTTSIVCSTTVNFTNTSYNAYTYVWDFGDGSPAVTTTNASHVYSASGTYNVTLTATNPYGSNINTQTIVITNPLVPVITACSPTMLTCSSSIPKMTHLTIDGHSTFLSASVFDYTCTQQFHLVSDTSYYFFIDGNGKDNNYMALIDNNNDGTFTLSESLYPGGVNIVNVGETSTGHIPATTPVTMYIPADIQDSIPLRMRLMMSTSFINSSTVCGSTLCGDYKDFTVFITARPVKAAFTASPLNTCSATGPVSVTFNNTSRSDVNWLWDFGDGFTSASINPTHTYSTFGSFTVKLKVWDNNGNVDSLIMPNYVNIFPALTTPVITASGNLLSTSETAVSYQWKLNGTPIPGATAPSYLATTGGNYTITLINGGTCTITSLPYHLDYIVPGFHADTLVYCGTATASVDFINTSTGATTYNWDFGDGSPVSSLVSPTHLYNLPGTYTVQLVACDTVCDTLQFLNYITIDSAAFYVNLTSGLPDMFCNGDTVMLSAASPAGVSYQWLNAGMAIPGENNDTLAVSATGNYSLAIFNALGCADTSGAITVWADTACVWPGDADDNFVVDHYDLLPIGVGYGQTGPARSTVSNTWSAFPAFNWGTTEASGADIKHADCNGDGIINFSDTMAIDLNYTSTHLLPLLSQTGVRSADPDLYCTSALTTYTTGTWADIDIMAGTSAEPVAGLYGVGFALSYDNSVIEPGTASMIFSDSWLTDLAADGLDFYRIESAASQVKASVTRISHTGKSGFGKLATFRFKVNNTLTATTIGNFTVTAFQANDEAGEPLNFDYGTSYPVTFEPVATGLTETNAVTGLQIYPNPYTDAVTFRYSLPAESDVKIEIMNAMGELVYTVYNNRQAAGHYSQQLNSKTALEEGLYLVKFTVNGISTTRNLVHLK